MKIKTNFFFLAGTSVLQRCWSFWNKCNKDAERFVILNEEEKNYFLDEVFNCNFLSFTSAFTDSLELFWNPTFCVWENIHTKRKWTFPRRDKWCRHDSRIFTDNPKDVGPDPVTFHLAVLNSRGASWLYKISNLLNQMQLWSTPGGPNAGRRLSGRPARSLDACICLLDEALWLVGRERDCHRTPADLCAIYTGITTWSVMRSGI